MRSAASLIAIAWRRRLVDHPCPNLHGYRSMNHYRLGRAVLSSKGSRWQRTGHPWTFRDDIAELDEGRGHLVEVFGHKGHRLGIATWSPESKIALRMIEPGATAEIPDLQAFFRQRLEAAIRRRRPLEAETDAWRILSSEADGLPGYIVDRYAEVLVLQSLTPFAERYLGILVPLLVERLEPEMILARNDVGVRRLEGLPQVVELLHGRRIPRVRIEEHGLRLEIDPYKGQKTGFFLDQRPARKLVETLCAEYGGPVLDLCSYTGGFTLHAARGGAQSVLSVDQSQDALDEIRSAATRNDLDGIDTLRGNVFDLVKQLLHEGRRFRGIVLDPPAFAKSRREVQGATRGYQDLNSKSLRLLEPGGWLLTCSCSYNMTPELFLAMLRKSAARAGVACLDHGRLGPAVDHPVPLNLPEADYLKVHHLERR